MLVPVTMSTGTRSSSSTWSTPRCAAPRAPPPDSTRPSLGRPALALAGFSRAATTGGANRIATATRVARIRSVRRVCIGQRLTAATRRAQAPGRGRRFGRARPSAPPRSVERRVDEAHHHAHDVLAVVAVVDLAFAVQAFDAHAQPLEHLVDEVEAAVVGLVVGGRQLATRVVDVHV